MEGWASLPAVLSVLPAMPEGVDTPLGGAAAPDGGGDRPATVAALCRSLGRDVANPGLLRVAVTHPSWANEHRRAGWPSNGCLEFYGDAVLDLLAADALWRRFPELPEGDLTRLRAALVSEGALADAARRLDLGAFLFLGKGDERNGFRDHAATLADAFEATLGAVFLDAKVAGHDPFAACGVVFERAFGERVAQMSPTDGLDPKSALQRIVQGKHRVAPRYRTLGEAGDAESTRWRVAVELAVRGGATRSLAEGEGRSLQEAERAAAAAALVRWKSGDLEF